VICFAVLESQQRPRVVAGRDHGLQRLIVLRLEPQLVAPRSR
jgi:hypothetical protein